MEREGTTKDRPATARRPFAATEAAARGAVERGEIPGVVAIAGDGSDILYEGAFGVSDVAKGDRLAADQVFWVASMTKAITCVAGAQMLEQGRMSLDQEAATILPELKRFQVLTGFDAAGKPYLRPAKRAMIVRQLFTHTAGHTTDIWSQNGVRYIAEMKVPRMPTCLNAALDTPLAFDPGERWEYGTSIDWIGKIVEALSGLRLEEYFRQHIFEPLGMTWTSFIISPAQRARLAPLHLRNDDGSFRSTDFEISQTPEFYMGGAGLYTTAEDYLKFLQMLLNHGRGNGVAVLEPATVDLFFANQIGDLDMPVMRTFNPPLSYDVNLLPGTKKKWSLGFMLNMADVEGRRSAGSGFWAGLNNCYYWVDRKKQRAGMTLMSYFPFVDPPALRVFDALERDAYLANRGAAVIAQ